MTLKQGSTKGFKLTATLLTDRIRLAGETRGFAVSRVLTGWPEIVGDDIAAIARPVNVSYGRGGFGATLTVLTTGAQAPMLEMQKEQLRTKVNAVYGYNAIARVRITQTAASGFAEGKVAFGHQKPTIDTAPPDPALRQKAAEATKPVSDDGLRDALARLGENILNKMKR